MLYIGQNADIREGDLIVTNGLGGKYPAGVYIGKVLKAGLDPVGLQKTAEIEPAANLRVLDKVFVVLHVDEASLIAREIREAKAAEEANKPKAGGME